MDIATSDTAPAQEYEKELDSERQRWRSSIERRP
jgi:hypothetical protein